MATEHDPYDLRAQAASDANRAEADKLSRLEELDDIRWLMSSRRGRRIVWKWLSKCGVFRVSFTGEALGTAFHEGERNVGLQLLAQVNEVSPGHYATMLDEQRGKHDRKRDDGR